MIQPTTSRGPRALSRVAPITTHDVVRHVAATLLFIALMLVLVAQLAD